MPDQLDARADAEARLLALVDGLDLAPPSLLPGWSRAHVVAHLANNARSFVRLLEGAMADEVRDQYVGGRDGRAADIERLAADPDAARTALAESVRELDEAFHAMPADAWERMCGMSGGALRPASRLPWARRREVEVHMVDLGASYTPADWSPEFGKLLLEELATGREVALAAWLFGRSDGADLGAGPLPALPPFL